MLELLYTDGALLIHHKAGSRKFYDLAQRHLPEALLSAPNPCADEAGFRQWRVKRRIGAVGLLWNRASSAWLGIDMDTAQRNEAFEALSAKGEIEAVRVEGIRAPLYLLAGDAPLLDAVLADAVDTTARLEFLAPLDPMLWDRKLIQALWDFAYTWEIYTPAEKRKYGYYALPMLHGQELIGRVEAAVDRKAAALCVKGLWLEDGVRWTKKRAAAVRSALLRLARFNGCAAVRAPDGSPWDASFNPNPI